MREPTEMELRVAKVLTPFCHWGGISPNSLPSDIEAWQSHMTTAIEQARAAIRAMHTPTEAMLELAERHDGRDTALGVWNDMIGLASPPQPPHD